MTPPTKTTDTLYRGYRGGGWNSPSANRVRAAYRNDITPTWLNGHFGFRLNQRGCRQPILKVQP